MSSDEQPPPLTESESALLRRDGEFMMEHAIALMSEAFVWGASPKPALTAAVANV
jgi:hypothetical protein